MAVAAILPFLPTIASGINSLIKGAGDIKSQKELSELTGRLSGEAKSLIPGLEKKVEQYDIGPSMRKLRQVAMEDPLGDIQRQELQRSQATGVEALKSGGAKSLFALPSLMQGVDKSRRQIDADAFGRMKSALTTVGQAEGMVARDKFRQNIADLSSARSQALGFELDQFAADRARRDAITGMVTGGLSTLGSLAASGAFGEGKAKSQTIPGDEYALSNPTTGYTPEGRKYNIGESSLEDFQVDLSGIESVDMDPELTPENLSTMATRQADVSSLSSFTPSQGLYGPGSLDAGARSTGSGAPFRPLTPPMVGALDLPDVATPYAPDISGSMDVRSLIDALGSNPALLRQLGLFAAGGRTKGPFNHDTNDMEIVDNNGKPTGMSVTGNEVVLNPQQQEKIAKQSSYFRSLMKTPRFR